MPKSPVTFQENAKIPGTMATAQHPRGIECYSSHPSIALDLDQIQSLGDLG
jgi:hypothetical protein